MLPGAFTRDRCLTLPRVAAMMISGMCSSVQSELDSFFGHLRGHAVRSREVSAQAFSKARRGFSARLFHLASQHLLELASAHIDATRWNGFRVVAADASRLRVSTRSNAQLSPDHYAFALFLPGTDLTLHASLHPADGSERQMLFEALGQLDAEGDLLVLDRGYVGNTMVAALDQRGLAFCLRADTRAWGCVEAFLRSDEHERTVTLAAPTGLDAATYDLVRQPTQVRLVRDITPNGHVRVLMTNLLDACRYPAEQFGALYHQRWRVEEAFKRIKHRLRLEAPTGLSYLALQQDFAAKVLADNLCVLLAARSQRPEAASRPNRIYAMGALKPILAGCLLAIAHARAALPAVLATIAKNRCRIQSGRSYPRPARVKPHLHLAYKAA
ncbi:IS4 family transposase [Denitromonas sp. IR12]|uniref:IS4 family transposase n=1 Tax=Denitromonas iodatirespirans TaxID=2795389 RepID=A0A944HA76_DENI1|nr:IS4 family transposase [Denitromonas iodatirespirans]